MTFEIENMELDMGDAIALVSGRATYDIEDQGIGGYECHGFKGHDSYKVAVFESCKITTWKLIDHLGKEISDLGLTKDDIEALQEVIVNELNENHELCCELAEDNQPDEPYE